MKLYVDASLNNKTKECGIGIASECGEVRLMYRCTMDTVLEAEKLAISLAIKYLRENSIKKPLIYTDSLFAVKELYGVNMGVRIEWKSRDFNLAHNLANQARKNKSTQEVKDFKIFRELNNNIAKKKARMRLESKQKQMMSKLREELKAELREELKAELRAEILEELRQEQSLN